MFDKKNIPPDNSGSNDIWVFHKEAFEVIQHWEFEENKRKQEENNRKK